MDKMQIYGVRIFPYILYLYTKVGNVATTFSEYAGCQNCVVAVDSGRANIAVQNAKSEACVQNIDKADLLVQKEMTKLDTAQSDRNKRHNGVIDTQISQEVYMSKMEAVQIGYDAVCDHISADFGDRHVEQEGLLQVDDVQEKLICSHELKSNITSWADEVEDEMVAEPMAVTATIPCVTAEVLLQNLENLKEESQISTKVDDRDDTNVVKGKQQEGKETVEAEFTGSVLARKVKAAGFHSPIPKKKKSTSSSVSRSTPSPNKKLRWIDEEEEQARIISQLSPSELAELTRKEIVQLMKEPDKNKAPAIKYDTELPIDFDPIMTNQEEEIYWSKLVWNRFQLITRRSVSPVGGWTIWIMMQEMH